MNDIAEKTNEKKAKIPLAEQAYQAMKWAILTTKLRPGTIHNEEQLSRDFGFGRSPVHLSLIRLEIDGLVKIIPRKGILIPVVTHEDIRNILEVRLPIERTIVQYAIERASDEELKALKALLSKGNEMAPDDKEGYMRLDQEFHKHLAKCTHNDVLVETLDMLHHRSSILWFANISSEKDYRAVQKEHETLLKAIIKRDQKKAESLLTEHLTRFINKGNNQLMM